MQSAADIPPSRLLDAARVYDWSAVVTTQTIAQEHWGEYRPAAPGVTAGQAAEVIRRLCAERMGAPEGVVRLLRLHLVPK
ncbi:hypothetical protein [Streptomyces sp. NPDC001889]